MTPTATTEPDIDKVATPELRAALARFSERRDARQRADADLQAARADLTAAIGAGDRERTSTLAGRLRELEIILEATPEPDFAREVAGNIRRVVEAVFVRFAAAVEARRGQHIEAARRAGMRWGQFQGRYRLWARDGADASEGVALVNEAGYWARWLDDFEATYPPTPRPADSLAHAAPRPPRPPLIFQGDR
jgi:uncharacterized protein with PIN domain